jgi:hypothetical protein
VVDGLVGGVDVAGDAAVEHVPDQEGVGFVTDLGIRKPFFVAPYFRTRVTR